MNQPTTLIGFMRGRLRRERCGGVQLVAEKDATLFLFNVRAKTIFPDESPYAVTHLQKYAARWWPGFLLESHEKWWQLCFHIWFTIRPQQWGEGGWVPNSEIVAYFRVGWSRWDAGDCKYVQGYTFKIGRFTFTIPFGTWYGPGLHWD